jgi:hypothetical protein
MRVKGGDRANREVEAVHSTKANERDKPAFFARTL